MIEGWLAPFEFQYMVRLFWATTLLGAATGILSPFLNLKNWALVGDALAHSVIPGVAVALILSLPYLMGALFAGLLASLALLILERLTTLKIDALIGTIFSSFMALGLLLINLNPTTLPLESIIFGNPLGISDGEFWQLATLSLLTLLLIALFWRTLTLMLFDEVQAHSLGMNPLPWLILFFALLSGMIVVAIQSVGAILVISMVITPGAVALLWRQSLPFMMIFSPLFGIFTTFFGTYFSFFLGSSVGSTIILLQVSLFFLTLLGRAFLIEGRKHRSKGEA